MAIPDTDELVEISILVPKWAAFRLCELAYLQSDTPHRLAGNIVREVMYDDMVEHGELHDHATTLQ